MMRVILSLLLAIFLGQFQVIENPTMVTAEQTVSAEPEWFAAEWDACVKLVESEVVTKIITRQCGKYDAAPKRQVIVTRNGKFVGGKVIGYANAFQLANF